MKTKQVKKLLRKYLRTWIHNTGLGYWAISAAFKNGVKERPNDLLLGGHCEADWRYQRAHITFYPKAMRHLAPEEIEATVVHELIHVFLAEMHEGDTDHEERVATQIEKAFVWVRDNAEDAKE